MNIFGEGIILPGGETYAPLRPVSVDPTRACGPKTNSANDQVEPLLSTLDCRLDINWTALDTVGVSQLLMRC